MPYKVVISWSVSDPRNTLAPPNPRMVCCTLPRFTAAAEAVRVSGIFGGMVTVDGVLLDFLQPMDRTTAAVAIRLIVIDLIYQVYKIILT